MTRRGKKHQIQEGTGISQHAYLIKCLVNICSPSRPKELDKAVS
jgi:hypothetical protein